MSFLWSLASFIIVIGILVSVHEYGHFWAARKCGIKVHRFSIGFGKTLWSRKDKYGTEFAISMIPLGGYVKMLDERNEEVPATLKVQAFNHKSIAQRAFVIAAGPVANFLFAIFAYWLVYLIGIPSVKPVIENIQPNSIAAQAQIEAHSQIIAIDGEQANDWETINMLLATKMGNSNVELTLQTEGNVEQKKQLNLSNWSFDPDKENAFQSLGIQPIQPKIDFILSNVAEDSPASKAGLQKGDEIISVNQTKMAWQDFANFIQQSEGQSLTLEVKRDQAIHQISLLPELNSQKKWYIGVSPTFYPIADEYLTELKYDMLTAVKKGIEKTAQISLVTIKVIGKLFTGDLSLNNLSGPISIAKGAGISSEIGFVYYLSFMALISVNLGIMNLFPLPVLDGGHLAFLAAEGVMGKPVSDRVQDISYRLGAILLLMLTVFAIFNDFLRL